ncbi:transposase, partial [Collinsella sp. LCP21S3_A3]|uniref:transposase n=1 Tax=Collinsella sp. LCP21S3_A3 TaxID=3438769 RepID=UPI003F90F8FA
IASSLDADIEDLCGRPLDGSPVPYVWLDATYVKCRRGGRVASTAVVTAIGCDAGGRGRVLGVDVVDTESYDSWLAFLRAIRSRGAAGVRLVVSDAHPGLVRALGEV